MKVQGSIIDAGPLPALIQCPQPHELRFTSFTKETYTIAKVKMPTLKTSRAKETPIGTNFLSLGFR
jgi:hypothetical protein